MQIGDTITLGSYAAEPVEWKAIAQKDGKFLLLSCRILDIRPLHPVDESEKMNHQESYYETGWRECELRNWLNGAFAESVFTPEEFAHIPPVTHSYVSVYKTLHSFFKGDEQTQDRVFLLSEEEFFRFLTDSRDRIGVPTQQLARRWTYTGPHPELFGQRYQWWLRDSVRIGYGAHCKAVGNTGADAAPGKDYGPSVWSKDVGVRPAVWYIP